MPTKNAALHRDIGYTRRRELSLSHVCLGARWPSVTQFVRDVRTDRCFFDVASGPLNRAIALHQGTQRTLEPRLFVLATTVARVRLMATSMLKRDLHLVESLAHKERLCSR